MITRLLKNTKKNWLRRNHPVYVYVCVCRYTGFTVLIYPSHAKKFFAITGPSVLEEAQFRDQTYGDSETSGFTRDVNDEL